MNGDDEDEELEDEEEEVFSRDPKAFRRDLDAVLARRDPAALRAFLIEQEQWTEETTTDPETAMWLMIAASPTHNALHPEAEAWLRGHGHAAEAEAILGRSGGGKSAGKGQRQGPQGRGQAHNRGGNARTAHPGQRPGAPQGGPPKGQHPGRPGQGGRDTGGASRPTHGGTPTQRREPRPPRGS